MSYGSDMECLLTRNTLWRVAFVNYVYKTCDDTSKNHSATYAEMICKVTEVSQKYDVHSFIIGGDFNTSFI